MAYKNLISIACVDKAEFFCRMRDYMCARNGTYDYSTVGIGWSIVDSSYAVDEDNPELNDWYVIYSIGESGDEDLFFYVKWLNDYIQVQGYQSWNTTTHTGVNYYYSATQAIKYTEGVSSSLWIYGDLDVFTIVYDIGDTYYYLFTAGKALPIYDRQDETVATCSSSLTTGSDVSITVDAVPSSWAVGRDLFIRTTHNDDNTTVQVEKTTIKTISGNTITVDLTYSYTAGSKLSNFLGYFQQYKYSSFVSQFYAFISNKGTKQKQHNLSYNFSTLIQYADPDPYEDIYPASEYYMYESSSKDGGLGKLKIRRIDDTGITNEDVLDEQDGTQWRAFQCGSTAFIVVKEI